MSKSLPFRILPWNDHKGALSLTFDDGDPSQLDFAIPEMEKRGLKGTFYLIAEKLTRPEDWKKAAARGQEIGNHSLNHKRVKDLVPGETEKQVADAKKKLEDLTQAPVPTFAYPFTEINPALRGSAQCHHLLARGGMGEYYFTPDSEPDWAYLPSQVAMSMTSPGIYKGWAEEALRRRSWTLPQFHAFEGTVSGWQPLPRKNFTEFLDHIVELKRDLWIAPLGEVGLYWLAQKRVEEAVIEEKKRLTLTWKTGDLFPKGIRLKAMMDDNSSKVFQMGRAVPSSLNGVFEISFDEKELIIEPI